MKTTLETIKLAAKDCLKRWKPLLLFSILFRLPLAILVVRFYTLHEYALFHWISGDLLLDYKIINGETIISTLLSFFIQYFIIEICIVMPLYLILFSPPQSRIKAILRSRGQNCKRFIGFRLITLGTYTLWLGLQLLLQRLVFTCSLSGNIYAGAAIHGIYTFILLVTILLIPLFLWLKYSIKFSIMEENTSIKAAFKRSLHLLKGPGKKEFISYLFIEFSMMTPYLISLVYMYFTNYGMWMILPEKMYLLMPFLAMLLEPLRLASQIRFFRSVYKKLC